MNPTNLKQKLSQTKGLYVNKIHDLNDLNLAS